MAHCQRPCRLCPFSRNTAPGWLGPWDADELLKAIPYVSFPCHETIKSGDSEDEPHHRTCAGAAIFLNKKIQLSRSPIMVEAQRALNTAANDIKAVVFNSPTEFLAFHRKSRNEPQ